MPAVLSDGSAQLCTPQQQNTCSLGYWCHVGQAAATTLCCPGGESVATWAISFSFQPATRAACRCLAARAARCWRAGTTTPTRRPVCPSRTRAGAAIRTTTSRCRSAGGGEEQNFRQSANSTIPASLHNPLQRHPVFFADAPSTRTRARPASRTSACRARSPAAAPSRRPPVPPPTGATWAPRWRRPSAAPAPAIRAHCRRRRATGRRRCSGAVMFHTSIGVAIRTKNIITGALHNTHRFFYDGASQVCRQFSYSGFGGNENNFMTLAACEQRCPGEFRMHENQRFSSVPQPLRLRRPGAHARHQPDRRLLRAQSAGVSQFVLVPRGRR